MQLTRSTLLFLVPGMLTFFPGCMEEDFSSDPAHLLTYSTDTVRFDTLFTTIGSATNKLMVYNRNGKPLNIATISLKSGGSSGFRINVDGKKGTRFENVEINKKDSLYIFVEVTIKPTQQNVPQRTEEIIRFDYNGISQEILLEAFGQDAFFWRGKVLNSDTVLTGIKPILVYDSLVIEPQAHILFEAGTRLFFHDKAKVIVRGSIEARGELGKPVLFRGNRTDKLFPDLPYDGLPGQWGGIIFEETSYDNQLTHAHLRGTDFGIRLDSASLDRKKLVMESCIVKNSNQELIAAEHVRMEASNCEFSNSAGALLFLNGGAYRFTHCTMANFFKVGIINDAAVHLSNYKYDDGGQKYALPLQQADFNNCIIWGNRSTELSLSPLSEPANENQPFNHRFDHCLIKAKGEDDQNFIATIWNKDPLFKATGEAYHYDFRPDSLSPARKAGTIEYAIEFPFDLNGNVRTSDHPDLGAYQWKTGE